MQKPPPAGVTTGSADEEHLSHLFFLESLERVDRAIRQAGSLEGMLADVLDTALAIFESDRAWLLYPCDPEAPTWRVRMERTRSEYPGALAMGVDFPTTPEVRHVFLETLNSSGPIVYGPQPARPVPQVARQFSVQSQIQTAVYPKLGKAWIFGMHQCSRARAWSDKDVRLFTEIARRIADGLSSLLFLNDLQKSEEKFRFLFETMTQGVILQDEESRIIEVNRAACEILGLSMDQLLGRTSYDPAWKLIREDGSPLAPEELPSNIALKTGRPVLNVTLGVYLPMIETYRWVLMSSAPQFKPGDQTPPVTITTLTDITMHRELEEQLRQSQKMEAVGHLAGGIAHDFNNILTAIMGFGDMAQRRIKDDPVLQDYIKQVLRGADRAADLTRGLLAFSRKQIISPRAVDLNEIIRNMEKMLIRIIGEDIELKTILHKKELTVMVDAGQMDQVLLNLATNARDSMPDGGRLVIETDIVNIDAGYAEAHLFESTGKYGVVTVSDTGKGMDLKTKENIFEPFFTTKEVGKGTGLGLAIVYGIIKQHGGNINVYSEPGKGATFRIYLPMAQAKTGKAEKTVSTTPRGRGETILIAEDDAQVRNIVRIYLQDFGYEVLEAANGVEAVMKFKESEDKVSALLLDVIMPIKNGRDAYEEIKDLRPGIKVIFMSGYSDDIIARKGVLEDGFGFISKPIDIDALLEKIRDALDGENK